MTIPTLPQPYQAELLGAVAPLAGRPPLPVVLASGDHAPLLENWIRHAADHISDRVRHGDYTFTCYPDAVSASLGLRIGLLPHHLFPRLAGLSARAFVVHPLTPNALDAKLASLHEAGFWMPGDCADGGDPHSCHAT